MRKHSSRTRGRHLATPGYNSLLAPGFFTWTESDAVFRIRRKPARGAALLILHVLNHTKLRRPSQQG